MRYSFIGDEIQSHPIHKFIPKVFEDYVFLPSDTERMEAVKKSIPVENKKLQFVESTIITMSDCNDQIVDDMKKLKKKGVEVLTGRQLPPADSLDSLTDEEIQYNILEWVLEGVWPVQEEVVDESEEDIFGFGEDDLFSENDFSDIAEEEPDVEDLEPADEKVKIEEVFDFSDVVPDDDVEFEKDGLTKFDVPVYDESQDEDVMVYTSGVDEVVSNFSELGSFKNAPIIVEPTDINGIESFNEDSGVVKVRPKFGSDDFNSDDFGSDDSPLNSVEADVDDWGLDLSEDSLEPEPLVEPLAEEVQESDSDNLSQPDHDVASLPPLKKRKKKRRKLDSSKTLSAKKQFESDSLIPSEIEEDVIDSPISWGSGFDDDDLTSLNENESQSSDIMIEKLEFDGEIPTDSQVKTEPQERFGEHGKQESNGQLDSVGDDFSLVKIKDEAMNSEETLDIFDTYSLDSAADYQTNVNELPKKRIEEIMERNTFNDPAESITTEVSEDEPPFVQRLPKTDRVEQVLKRDIVSSIGRDYTVDNGASRLYYVTGTSGGVGKTTVSYAMASFTAKAFGYLARKFGGDVQDVNKKVYLIEFDWSNPKLQLILNSQNTIESFVERILKSTGEDYKNSDVVSDGIKKSMIKDPSTGLGIIPAPFDHNYSTAHSNQLLMAYMLFIKFLMADTDGSIIFIDAPTIDPIRKDKSAISLFKAFEPHVVLITRPDLDSLQLVRKYTTDLTDPIDGKSYSRGGATVTRYGYGVNRDNISLVVNKLPKQDSGGLIKTIIKSFTDESVITLKGFIPEIESLKTKFAANLTGPELSMLEKSTGIILRNMGFESLGLLYDEKVVRLNTKKPGFLTKIVKRFKK